MKSMFSSVWKWAAIPCFLVLLAYWSGWSKLQQSYRAGKHSENLSLLEPRGPAIAERIIFVSCNRQTISNPFWDMIIEAEPSGFLWMGDIVYADMPGSQKQVMWELLKNLVTRPMTTFEAVFKRTKKIFPPANLEMIRNSYLTVLSEPKYQSILQLPSLKWVDGTWDDHDFGENDGDKSYPLKDSSKLLLLEFLGVPSTDERFQVDHPGIYTSREFTVTSWDNSTSHTLALIILDARYNKDPWGVENGDILGAQQWAWLEHLVSTSEADAHLITSSIQILPEGRFTESWNLFPASRRRLLDLISQKKLKNPIFLSGDVHLGEILHYDHRSLVDGHETTTSFLEITSSGMTHATRRTPFGVGLVEDLILRWVCPTRQTLRTPNDHIAMYTGRNMGVLDILYVEKSWVYAFQIVNSKREIVLEINYALKG